MKRLVCGLSWVLVLGFVFVLVTTSSTVWAVSEEDGACCLPNSGCVLAPSMEKCINDSGGIFAGEGTICAEVDCTFGACCEVVDSSAATVDGLAQANGIHICSYTLESNCDGQWNPTLTCDVEGCCDPTPGACVVDGKCTNVPRIDCLGKWSKTRCPEAVPTLTEWGLVLLSIALIGSATLVIRRRKRSS